VRNALQGNESTPVPVHSLAAKALQAATEAARAAAEVIEDATPRSGSLEWVEKSAADFVTEVDTASEARIVSVIHSILPEAAILGEELTPGNAVDPAVLTFIADPLDGTTNFLHAFPHYAVSIGAMYEGQLIAAVVLNVPRGDIFTATVGGGARLNDAVIGVSRIDSTAHALIGTGFPFKDPDLLEPYSRQFIEVSRQTAGIRRAGSAALDLADVACGRFDGFWELILAPWDVAAGILIVREAGGIVTNAVGTPVLPAHGPIVAGNPAIHPWLLRTVQSAAAS
jgi:myo-inositol-1(or 4)-monophosphatase